MPSTESIPDTVDNFIAFRMACSGATDEQIADRLGIDMPTMARWAWAYHGFYSAITPGAAEIAAVEGKRRDRRTKRSARKKARLASHPGKRIENAMRARMWAALKGRSDGALFSRLAYSQSALVTHIEAQFQDGMSWANYGEWHIDHIKPCAAFNQDDPVQFAQCWALENLRPLWARENIRKGARYGA